MKTLKVFRRTLSIETKMLFLISLSLVLFGYLMENNQMKFTIGALIAIALVLIVEYYMIFSYKYPSVWNTIKWIVFLIVIAFILIGSKS